MRSVGWALNPIEALAAFHRPPGCDCLTESCRSQESVCRIELSGRECRCFSCDACAAFLATPREKRADFVIFDHQPLPRSTVWCAVEMKSNVSHVRSIQHQLQATAGVIQDHERFAVTPIPAVLVPVLLYSGSISTADRDLLRNLRVVYRGRRMQIEVKKRTATLTDLVSGKHALPS